MAEKDWFRDIIAAEKRSTRKAPSMARAFGDYQAPSISMARAAAPYQVPAPSSTRAMNIPGTDTGPEMGSMSGMSGAPGAPRNFGPEYARQANLNRETEVPQTQLDDPNPGPGSRGSGLDKVFAPLFAALDQQRSNANSRYTANSGQITNIYGQLIGARTDDVDSINTAYERLQTAAASRGADTLSGMADRETNRVSQNQAVLGSMGLGDLGTAGNDVASAGAQAAQDTEAANQSNWSGMLDMMNATSQDIARADATSFGYRQGEDIARLQGAKEDYLQGVDQQDFNLQNQQAQAEYEYKQSQQRAAAAAAAAARKADQDAINAANEMDQQNLEAYLDNADPFTRGAFLASRAGIVSEQGIANMRDAYDQFLAGLPAPTLQQPYNKNLIAEDFGKSPYAEGLNKTERDLIKKAIRDTF